MARVAKWPALFIGGFAHDRILPQRFSNLMQRVFENPIFFPIGFRHHQKGEYDGQQAKTYGPNGQGSKNGKAKRLLTKVKTAL